MLHDAFVVNVIAPSQHGSKILNAEHEGPCRLVTKQGPSDV
jgi:hypothetical protein